MTTKQQARAISGVEISGKGTRRSDGAMLYGATSSSEPGRLHLIVWEERQQAWLCDCAGYAFRHHCRHVDALRFHLAAQRQAQAEPISPEDRFSLTEKGKVALAEHRAQAERREQSMLRQRPAFSLLK
jgi:hypothetical protein